LIKIKVIKKKLLQKKKKKKKTRNTRKGQLLKKTPKKKKKKKKKQGKAKIFDMRRNEEALQSAQFFTTASANRLVMCTGRRAFFKGEDRIERPIYLVFLGFSGESFHL